MIATSADVAKQAGVSRATVSQVLNGHADRFAPETAEKVYAAAAQLGYEPSSAGRTLRRGSSDFVVALLPNTTFSDNIQDIFEPISAALADHGYTLVLRLDSPAAALDRLIIGMKPAAVLSIVPFTAEQREVLGRRQVLAIDPPSVSQEDHNHAIGMLQANTLIAGGHTQLAFAHLRDARQDPFGFAREEGVRAVAREHGLPEVAVIHVDVDLDVAISALESLPTPGIAIACYNDDIAMALLSAAQVMGLDVPGDVAIIGMDRSRLSRIAVPRLTTIEYDLAAAATAATAGILNSLGAGAPAPTLAPATLALIQGDTV